MNANRDAAEKAIAPSEFIANSERSRSFASIQIAVWLSVLAGITVVMGLSVASFNSTKHRISVLESETQRLNENVEVTLEQAEAARKRTAERMSQLEGEFEELRARVRKDADGLEKLLSATTTETKAFEKRLSKVMSRTEAQTNKLTKDIAEIHERLERSIAKIEGRAKDTDRLFDEFKNKIRKLP